MPSMMISGSTAFDMSTINNAILEKEKAKDYEEPIEVSYSATKLREEVRKTWGEKDRRGTASMVVIGEFFLLPFRFLCRHCVTNLTEIVDLMELFLGHVDAGKSTLMGRLMFELGQLAEKQRINNERASEKIGKASFSWAWGLDSLDEERERCSLQ